MAQQSIHWDRQTFSIGGKDVVLIGGSMHYFRVPPEEWESTFERMQEDGFNLVDVYIPWFVHEPEEGKFDFDNLQKFLQLAHKHGLYVVARPGPYINSETDQGAFPRWLSGKNVGFRRDTDLDRQWSKHWYDAIMPVLAQNQITRGGPVIMVQIENEYGHPQYLSEAEKKAYVKFLYQAASRYSFDIPLMGNDMQFAEEDSSDPLLSKIYNTVDAYFDSYRGLEEMLARQRKLNVNTPLGCAEYGLAGAEATVRTMLGMGADYLDEYMFRAGSQFRYAAKGYELAGYSPNAIIEEGGYTLPNYGAMKTAAIFLRHFGETLARSDFALVPATADDPEIWVEQRNNGSQGFLFIRSDLRGVSERTLSLQTTSEQHISYVDPQSQEKRTIPQYSKLFLRNEQTRLLPLNLPVRGPSRLVYSTADLLGTYSHQNRTWLVFYGDPGEIAEATFKLTDKPASLNRQAVWRDDAKEAALLLPFGTRDQVLPLTTDISLLLVSRERAYRAKEFSVANQPALLISDADEALIAKSPDRITIDLETRHPLGNFTLLSSSRLKDVAVDGQSVPVQTVAGTQQFLANIPVPALSLSDAKIALTKSWQSFSSGFRANMITLTSLPRLGIWKKGITHYHASFPRQDGALRLAFFTDDYKTVSISGEFVPEASNGRTEAVLLEPCRHRDTCDLDIYYVDTGRPKEDLGLWRLDEKKGLASVEWLNGLMITAFHTEWQIEFADLDQLAVATPAPSSLTVLRYSFPRPQASPLTAVWRLFPPDVAGLVYLNGVYMEHHEPGRTPNIGRDGIYLPPSMLKDMNQVLFIAFEPISPNLQLPIIRVEQNSIRKEGQLLLEFASSHSLPSN